MGAQTTPPGPRIGSGDRRAVNNNNKKCRRVGGANGGVGWRGRLRSGAGKATQGEQPRRDAAASPDRLRAAGLRDDDILGKAKPWRRWRSRWRQGLGRGRGGPRGRDAPAQTRGAQRAKSDPCCMLRTRGDADQLVRTPRCDTRPAGSGVCTASAWGREPQEDSLDFPLNFAVNVKPL